MAGPRALEHEGKRALDVPGQKAEETVTAGFLPWACGERKGEPTVGRGRNVSCCPSTAGSHVASLGQGQGHGQTSNQRVEGETQHLAPQITASQKLTPVSILRTNARMQAAIMPSVHSPARAAVPAGGL